MARVDLNVFRKAQEVAFEINYAAYRATPGGFNYNSFDAMCDIAGITAAQKRAYLQSPQRRRKMRVRPATKAKLELLASYGPGADFTHLPVLLKAIDAKYGAGK